MKKILLASLMALFILSCAEEPKIERKEEPETPKVEPKDDGKKEDSNGKEDSKKEENQDNSNGKDDSKKEDNQGNSNEKDDSKKEENQDNSKKEENNNTGENSNKTEDTNGNNNTNPNDNKKEDENNGVQRPEDYILARNLQLSWIKESKYKTEFDFDALYHNDKSKFTAEYLSKFIKFQTQTQDGKVYILTKEDLKNLKFVNAKIRKDSWTSIISFEFKFNNNNIPTSSNRAPSLNFNHADYYKSMVKMDKSFENKYYLEGVYDNVWLFYGSAISYDTDKYIVEYTGEKKIDRSANTMTINVRMFKKDGGDENNPLAIFELELNKFKPLSNISKELTISSSSKLDNYFRDKAKLSTFPDGDVTDRFRRSANNVAGWIYISQIHRRLNGGLASMTKEEEADTTNGQSIYDVLIPDGNAFEQDLVLKRPRWELVSANKKDNKLNVVVKLLAANDQVLDIEFPFAITILK